ncbi:hypothetical protein CA984_09610 [Streptosporangium minutum]|uniref:Uncharacterized protein n=1 Tax=Streptosporangium minutum TaxID=569862 RepID=A0A243RRZ4_9ACTN|nr:hypothetical protein CA984_09610 [Streptosporangium minutum]
MERFGNWDIYGSSDNIQLSHIWPINQHAMLIYLSRAFGPVLAELSMLSQSLDGAFYLSMHIRLHAIGPLGGGLAPEAPHAKRHPPLPLGAAFDRVEVLDLAKQRFQEHVVDQAIGLEHLSTFHDCRDSARWIMVKRMLQDR